MDSTPTSTPPANHRSGMALRLALVVFVAAALIGGAWWMTGSAPKDADAGFAKAPPPLALPSDTADDSPLASAAARLATDDLDGARSAFIDIVAEDSDNVPAQIGLILSAWRGAGPKAVERDLTQLSKEYPEEAQVALHLGLVRSLVNEQRSSREALRTAIELGQQTADTTSLRMASLADDLLHPGGFSGYPPLLVQAADVAAPQRAGVETLLTAASSNDRLAAREAATALASAKDGMARVAAATAIYDKDDTSVSESRLQALADNSALTTSERDRARLHLALVTMWDGEGREQGCALLDTLSTAAVDAATKRLAAPIRAELCTESAGSDATS